MSRMVLSMNAVPRSSRHSSAASVADPNRACARLARLGRGHALVDQLLRLALEVEGELVVQLLLDAAGPEQRAHPQFQVAEIHGVYASFMTRPIAFDIRSQSRASTASWRRPEAVRW